MFKELSESESKINFKFSFIFSLIDKSMFQKSFDVQPYTVQWNRKWISSSILCSVHCLHSRFSLSMFVHLPASIAKVWLLVLSLVIAFLLLKLLICRYFSELYTPFNDFKKENLFVFWICANAVCEKTSLNRIKIALVKTVCFQNVVSIVFYLTPPNVWHSNFVQDIRDIIAKARFSYLHFFFF